MNGCSLDKNRNEALGKTGRQNDVRNCDSRFPGVVKQRAASKDVC